MILCILHGVARAGFPDGNVLVLERRRTDLAHSAAAWVVRFVAYVDSRNLKDEIEFWNSRKTGAKFQQVIRRIPQDIKGLAHGIHCSYCSTAIHNVQKLQHTNVVDGPPFLGEFYWDENVFAMLQACGIAPNGDVLQENHNNIDHVMFAEFNHFLYMKQDTVTVCHNIHSALSL